MPFTMSEWLGMTEEEKSKFFVAKPTSAKKILPCTPSGVVSKAQARVYAKWLLKECPEHDEVHLTWLDPKNSFLPMLEIVVKDDKDEKIVEDVAQQITAAADADVLLLDSLEACVQDTEGQPLVCYGCRDSAASLKFPGGPSGERPCMFCVRNPERAAWQEEAIKQTGHVLAEWYDGSPVVSYPMDCYISLSMAEQTGVWAALAEKPQPPLNAPENVKKFTEGVEAAIQPVSVKYSTNEFSIEVEGFEENLGEEISAAVQKAVQTRMLIKAGMPKESAEMLAGMLLSSVGMVISPSGKVLVTNKDMSVTEHQITTDTAKMKGLEGQHGQLADQLNEEIKKILFEQMKTPLSVKKGAENSKPPKKLMLNVKKGSIK